MASNSFLAALVGIVILAGMPFAGAQAQQSKSSALEEIVVTATRRVSAMEDVPISMTVFTEDRIEKSGFERITDLQYSTPGFVQTGQENSNWIQITMRGITTPTVSTGYALGIGMFIDGVDQGQPYAFNQELVDVERIEVLKGPQTTLFGKNTIAGAFSITTKKPAEEFGGQIEVTGGNYSLTNIKATVDMPLAEDKVLSKLSVYSKENDGFVRNVATGNDVMDQDQFGGRYQLRFTPSESFTADVSFDFMRENRTFAYHEIIEDTPGGVDYTGQIPDGLYTISHDFDDFEQRDLWGMQATLNYDFASGYSLTSISGYRYGSNSIKEDTDHTDRDDQIYFSDKNFDQFSQEIRFTSPSATESDRRFDYILGAYAMSQDSNQVNGYRFGVDSGLTPETMRTPSNLQSQQLSLFAQSNFYITEKLIADLGLRLNYENKKMGFSEEGFQNEVGLPATDYFEDSLDDTNLSPSLGLNYHFDNGVMAYGKAVVGYKSGAFNLGIFKGGPGDYSFDQEKVTSYEVGIRGATFERRLFVSLAAFYMDYESLQIEIQIPPAAPGLPPTRDRGAADAEISGIELETILRPVKGLTFELGLSQTTAEFTDDTPVLGGNDLPNSPDFTGYANATYEFDFGTDKSAYIRAEYTERGDWFSFATNLPNENPEGFSLFNASIGIEGESWSASVWGKNLSEEEYCTELWDVIGGYRCGIGRPRTYGVDFRYRF